MLISGFIKVHSSSLLNFRIEYTTFIQIKHQIILKGKHVKYVFVCACACNKLQ